MHLVSPPGEYSQSVFLGSTLKQFLYVLQACHICKMCKKNDTCSVNGMVVNGKGKHRWVTVTDSSNSKATSTRYIYYLIPAHKNDQCPT